MIMEYVRSQISSILRHFDFTCTNPIPFITFRLHRHVFGWQFWALFVTCEIVSLFIALSENNNNKMLFSRCSNRWTSIMIFSYYRNRTKFIELRNEKRLIFYDKRCFDNPEWFRRTIKNNLNLTIRPLMSELKYHNYYFVMQSVIKVHVSFFIMV